MRPFLRLKNTGKLERNTLVLVSMSGLNCMLIDNSL